MMSSKAIGILIHFLSFNFAGEDVPGSPFTVRVSGAPDASKVRVYGPGIEHGVLAIFQSRFICDTRGAGAGQLTVRVRGPKGDNQFSIKLAIISVCVYVYIFFFLKIGISQLFLQIFGIMLSLSS